MSNEFWPKNAWEFQNKSLAHNFQCFKSSVNFRIDENESNEAILRIKKLSKQHRIRRTWSRDVEKGEKPWKEENLLIPSVTQILRKISTPCSVKHQ